MNRPPRPRSPATPPPNELPWDAGVNRPAAPRADEEHRAAHAAIDPQGNWTDDWPEDETDDEEEPAERGNWLGSLLWRSLVLGVAAAAGAVAGVAGASTWPTVAVPWLWGRAEMPPLEQALAAIDHTWATWGQPTPSAPPSPVVTVDRLPDPLPEMPAARRQALQKELTALQADLNATLGRVGALERQLGQARPGDPLERRVQALERRLANEAPQVARPRQPNGRSLMTLPSDSLFAGSESILQPEATAILDSLLGELLVYPQAVVRVTVHTDRLGEAADNLELSLRRARAVVGYLSRRLAGQSPEGEDYRWVAIGAGEGQPVANGEEAASYQRNRRVEIAIDPGGNR